jgi:D-glycero-D-manno-heptose 1,7-bisphosphate phosphatase
MWQTFSEQNALAMITVYSNRDDYSRSNVRLGSDGFVLTYDMTRSTHGLQGVEIGYALMSKVAFSVLCNENVPFESVVYPHLAARHQLLGYLTEHKYYSVGSHERLPLTAEFLARRPTLLLDRDGVLNKRMPQGQYVRSWDEWAWLPGSLEALRLLREANYRVIVISNQPGIARGAMTEAVLHEIDQNMKKQARKAGGDIAKSYYCTHGWHDECLCRKPRPGMLFHAQRDFHLDLTRTWFIGDDDRDAEAATMAGCPWLMVTAERSLLDFTLDLLKFVS